MPSVCRPLNAGGMMPTTANLKPLRVTVLPITSKSEAKARFHKPSLITMTGAAPRVLSSSRVNVRPCARPHPGRRSSCR